MFIRFKENSFFSTVIMFCWINIVKFIFSTIQFLFLQTHYSQTFIFANVFDSNQCRDLLRTLLECVPYSHVYLTRMRTLLVCVPYTDEYMLKCASISLAYYFLWSSSSILYKFSTYIHIREFFLREAELSLVSCKR